MAASVANTMATRPRKASGRLVAAMPFLAEASIGHELTADALVIGFAAAVQAYKAALTPKA